MSASKLVRRRNRNWLENIYKQDSPTQDENDKKFQVVRVVPSYSLAIRILLLVRVSSAMYSNIQDCDEVYNFWEPLHFAHRGSGFQTWEVSPDYSIRSWAYILLHYMPAWVAYFLFGPDKRPVFFAIRILLAVFSTFCEAKLYLAVAKTLNVRLGRYLLLMLITSAGLWNAAAAFLPSSFAMYLITLAFAYSLEAPSFKNDKRTFTTTMLFAVGAVFGWPFSLAVAIPFVFEELFVAGNDIVLPETRLSWMVARCRRLFSFGFAASALFIPVFIIDSIIYGKYVLVPWNIVRYNVFGGSTRGPNLFGTSPWNFYFFNLLLNFNVLLPLALISLPALLVTHRIYGKVGLQPVRGQSSSFTILSIRLLPFYIWLALLTAQEHKEERFMFPIYPLLCFNAAVALYVMRGWLETAFIKLTKSPYRASKSSMFRIFTSSVITGSALLSFFRIQALWKYYHAPMTVFYALQAQELPHLLREANLISPSPEMGPNDQLPHIDLSPIKQFDLRLCLGKEWHRFPGHYLVPDGVKVDFVKSEFDGILPGHFQVNSSSGDDRWWLLGALRTQPKGLNDLNIEEASHYVPISTCDYLVDLDFPLHPSSTSLEPRYAIDAQTWERVFCAPFLDARHSSLLTRTLWMPGKTWQRLNEFGDYCLLKNWKVVMQKVMDVKANLNVSEPERDEDPFS